VISFSCSIKPYINKRKKNLLEFCISGTLLKIKIKPRLRSSFAVSYPIPVFPSVIKIVLPINDCLLINNCRLIQYRLNNHPVKTIYKKKYFILKSNQLLILIKERQKVHSNIFFKKIHLYFICIFKKMIVYRVCINVNCM
jgi:hypothetical protein